jgi:hypothetical protein
VARTSSAKKIARLAEKGKGKKVRFQGGSVFPSVVLGVLVIGALLMRAKVEQLLTQVFRPSKSTQQLLLSLIVMPLPQI